MKIEKALDWVKRDEAVEAKFSRLVYYPLVLKSGQGAMVEDMDGNRYIDLLASGGTINAGHSHPKIVDAVVAQMREYQNYSNPYFYNPRAIELAEKLAAIAPGDFPKKVSFGLSGSDANDGAIKLARAYTGRSKIVCFHGAYHGSTFGALSMTNISLNMRRKLGATLPDIYPLPFPNVYRNGAGDAERCLKELKAAFGSYLPPEEVAAVITEPIQGDAGIVIPPAAFMQELQAICREHGILLISEEVQQGFMRTGTWFGMENFGVVPDMILLAKAAGGGLPLSAIVGRAEVMDALDPPAHIFTCAANPVCCAAGLALVEILSEPGFREDLLKRSAYLKSLLEGLMDRHPLIGEVRGIGFTIGVEVVKDRQSKEPDRAATAKICHRAWERGAVLVSLGGNVLRIQPPLVISRAEIERAVAIIDAAMSDYENGDIPDSVLETVKGW